MAINADVAFVRADDGILTVVLNPSQAVGGWDINFRVAHRFGGTSGLIAASIASGIANGASGITILDSGLGTLNILVPGLKTSGLPLGNHAYTVTRADSGYQTVLVEGFISLKPN